MGKSSPGANLHFVHHETGLFMETLFEPGRSISKVDKLLVNGVFRELLSGTYPKPQESFYA